MVVSSDMSSLGRFAWRSFQLFMKGIEAIGGDLHPLTSVRGRPAGMRLLWSRDEEGLLRGGIKRFNIDGTEFRFFFVEELDGIQRFHRRGSIYEAEELALIAENYKGGVFVDVGANIGNHAIYVAKLLNAPKVIAFEPVPLSADLFDINVALNGCSDRVVLHRVGLSDEPTRANPVSVMHNLGGTRLAAGDGPIEIVRGDDVLASENVSFIKIDTEGYELKVLAGLKGLLERCRPILFVEAENRQIEDFRDFCDANGYRISGERRRYEDCTNFLAEPK
jgi:FkbM family methyltransferase